MRIISVDLSACLKFLPFAPFMGEHFHLHKTTVIHSISKMRIVFQFNVEPEPHVRLYLGLLYAYFVSL